MQILHGRTDTWVSVRFSPLIGVPTVGVGAIRQGESNNANPPEGCPQYIYIYIYIYISHGFIGASAASAANTHRYVENITKPHPQNYSYPLQYADYGPQKRDHSLDQYPYSVVA